MNYDDINLLHVGDKVQIKREVVEWYCANLVWLMACRENKELDVWEFREEDYKEIYAWLFCYMKNFEPFGYVESYGSEEDYSKRKNLILRIQDPVRGLFKLILKESDVNILELI